MVVEVKEGSREVGKGYIEKFVSFVPHVLDRGKILYVFPACVYASN